ncbi:hypothetical protein RFI_31455 [Reticulomyxa filosa]|uniref:Uncharacterized protein n=1 Tax=Reticulomyxa filosa TaxID=46433 RepID=X6LXT0_RETFI|nr:hypothetical protein RFI_31455 [Reticulomyxa filosa]|eukprot:ETO05942.1 hypothetical protein RFI_31455 [Reticulomyxa filosa]
MPNGHELEYHYKGASIGVLSEQTITHTHTSNVSLFYLFIFLSLQCLLFFLKKKGVNHHGGFDIVAQTLNLSPCRSYIYSEEEYPVWIEELRMIEKAKDFKKNENLKISAHRHILPPYLQNGLNSDNNDKRRLIKQIYSKLNIRLHAMDLRKKKAAETAWKNYKQNYVPKLKKKNNGFYRIPNSMASLMDFYKVHKNKISPMMTDMFRSMKAINMNISCYISMKRVIYYQRKKKKPLIQKHGREKLKKFGEIIKPIDKIKSWPKKRSRLTPSLLSNRVMTCLKYLILVFISSATFFLKKSHFFQSEFIANFEILKNGCFNNICTSYAVRKIMYTISLQKLFYITILIVSVRNCEDRNTLQFYLKFFQFEKNYVREIVTCVKQKIGLILTEQLYQMHKTMQNV